MNIIFHTAASFGIAVSLSVRKEKSGRLSLLKRTLLAIVLGILCHGIMDILPHNYYLSGKYDLALSLLIIVILLIFINHPAKLVLLSSFTGSVLPDIIDLLPSVLIKYFDLQQTIYEPISPWHLKEYSGSVYTFDLISVFYHLLVVVILFCILRRQKLISLFKK